MIHTCLLRRRRSTEIFLRGEEITSGVRSQKGKEVEFEARRKPYKAYWFQKMISPLLIGLSKPSHLYKTPSHFAWLRLIKHSAPKLRSHASARVVSRLNGSTIPRCSRRRPKLGASESSEPGAFWSYKRWVCFGRSPENKPWIVFFFFCDVFSNLGLRHRFF